jgi:hypothetical protein
LILALNIFFAGLNFLVSSPVSLVDLENVRQQYEKAPADKEICKNMISSLANAESDIHLAYLGAYQTIWANHVFNPFSKLSTFREGKANIEQAVLRSKDNAEIRFIRLSVQQNCPRFLGYHDHVEEDRTYLMNHKNTIPSPVVIKMVDELLSQ